MSAAVDPMVAFTVGGFEVFGPAIVLGAIVGMAYGILAVGLVLVYRSNRIVNFAHGEIGAFAAALLGLAVRQWGVPYWVAFPLALLVGAAIGAASEVVVVRRLRRAPLVMTMVATLGLAQFLLLFALVVNSQATAGGLFPQPPWFPEFDVGALLVTRPYSAILLLTPVLVLALALGLRRTRLGLGIRAASASRDLARLAGISADGMSMTSWAIAGAVAAFTAVLVVPTLGFAGGQVLGPSLLLRALAAAVIARMVNLPVAFLAGIGIGVVEQLLLWNYPRGGTVEFAIFVILLVALLLQRRQRVREAAAESAWVNVQPWPPIRDALRNVWAIRNLGWLVAVAALVAALLLPMFVTSATTIVLVSILTFSLVGLSVGVVTGLAGQLTLGQFAIAGVGATASYAVTDATGNFFLGFLGAALAAGAVSLALALPALRIRGLMLAVTTLGFALASQAWLFRQSWMLGPGVTPGRPVIGSLALDSSKEYYFFALGVLLIGFWLARNIWASGIGRRLRAVRDNEDGARAFTVRVTAVKVQGFVLAGVLAGLGGAAYGHSFTRLASTAFPVEASIDVAAMTVLGGIGVLAGPLLGALYIVGVPRFLPLDNAGLAATALGWLVLILYFPGGIAQLLAPLRARVIGVLARARGIEATAPERAGPVPSSVGGRARLEKATRAGGTLCVEGLTKHFGGLHAVEDVSFVVEAGETVAFIGPNGAGKSTLFDLASGFVRSDRGQVVLDDRDVSGLSPGARGRLGLVRSFQEPQLFPTMTVSDVVMLALERRYPTRLLPALIGIGSAERRRRSRAELLVDALGLAEYRSTPVSELSTGTRRITELACILALEPGVLLLDEPSSGIAQRETEHLGALLRSVQAQLGTTLLIVEHDIPLVLGLADRVVVMESGRVLMVGTPDEVRSDPRVIEAYLGTDAESLARSGPAA